MEPAPTPVSPTAIAMTNPIRKVMSGTVLHGTRLSLSYPTIILKSMGIPVILIAERVGRIQVIDGLDGVCTAGLPYPNRLYN